MAETAYPGRITYAVINRLASKASLDEAASRADPGAARTSGGSRAAPAAGAGGVASRAGSEAAESDARRPRRGSRRLGAGLHTVL